MTVDTHRSCSCAWCSSNNIGAQVDVTDDYLNIDKFSTLGFDRLTRAAMREGNS